MFDGLYLTFEFWLPWLVPVACSWFVHWNMQAPRFLKTPWHYFWWGIMTFMLVDFVWKMPKG